MGDIYEEITGLKKRGESAVLLTVVEKNGFGPAVPGIKMLVFNDGRRMGTVGGGALEQYAYEKALTLLKTRENLLQKYLLNEENKVIDGEKLGMVCGGDVTIFYEYMDPGTKIYIFGAGHVGRALVYHLSTMNYFITVFDDREGIFNDFTGSDININKDYIKAIEETDISEGSYILITTPSHAHDYDVLKKIYEKNCNPRYIGMLASKTKSELLVKRLKDEMGDNIDLSILRTPVGLDIGGPTPHEIAISIISQIQSIKYSKEAENRLSKLWST